MRLIVINLERFWERREFMDARLNDLGVQFELFAAFDGSRGEHETISRYDKKGSLQRFGAPLSPGEIGCFASHFSLWQRCLEEQQPIAVLEDDVVLSPGFPDSLALAEKLIMQHRFVRLAGYYDRPFRTIEEFSGGRRLVRFLRGPAGMQCYCLSPEGAAALLAAAQFWIEPVDLFIDRFWSHGVQSKALLPFEAREHDRRLLPQTIERQFTRKGGAKLRREWMRIADQVARASYNLVHQ